MKCQHFISGAGELLHSKAFIYLFTACVFLKRNLKQLRTACNKGKIIRKKYERGNRVNIPTRRVNIVTMMEYKPVSKILGSRKRQKTNYIMLSISLFFFFFKGIKFFWFKTHVSNRVHYVRDTGLIHSVNM